MTSYGENVFWRHAQKPAKLGPIDYRATFSILPLFFYFRLSTLILTILTLLIFWILQKRNINPSNALRWVIASCVGPLRLAHGKQNLRPTIDFGFETEEDVAKMDALISHRIKQVVDGKRAGASHFSLKDREVKITLTGARSS